MKKSYDMLFPTKRLVKNPSGNINILGQKFMLQVDSLFQHLGNIEKVDISDLEKLFCIAYGSFDAKVGGKFFKRAFLEENNLYFSEDTNVNAELKFMVDAMLCSKKIFAVPDCIYGRL